MPEEAEKKDDVTAAEEIAAARGRRKKQRDIEDRCSVLEDDNDTLRSTVKALEKQLKGISDSLKTKPGSNGEKSLWEELEDFFKW